MTKLQLLEKCEEYGIKKSKSKSKRVSIDLIFEKINSQNENKKNNYNGNEDEDGKNHKYTFIEVCSGGKELSSGLIVSGFTPLLLLKC